MIFTRFPQDFPDGNLLLWFHLYFYENVGILSLSSFAESCSVVEDYIDIHPSPIDDNEVEPDETFIDYSYEEEEEGEEGAKVEHSVTTEHIDEADEEEVEESSSFIPDNEEEEEEGNTLHEIDSNIVFENLPRGLAANDSNVPKGPYVHVGRSRKSESKSSSASVVGTQSDLNEETQPSSKTTVHTCSLFTYLCVIIVTFRFIHLDPVR